MSTTLAYGIERAVEFEAAFLVHLELKSSAALYAIEPDKLEQSRRHFLERYQVERAAADQGVPLSRIRADRKARRKGKRGRTVPLDLEAQHDHTVPHGKLGNERD